MKKFKTLDGYNVYRIKKENQFFFLADRLNYKKEIDKLLDTLDDLKFDSLIFLFGIDTGEYIEKIKKVMCSRNKVIIFEPNQDVYKKHSLYATDHIEIVLFEEKQVKKILNDHISSKNFNNIYFHAFGNYSKIYKKEYDCLVEHLDWVIINASAQIGLANRFKKVFIQNMIANLRILNQCTPIHHYIFTNMDVPAIVISGGPSLDRNIQDMIKYKDKVEKCFIITGSRTVGALIKNNIIPDMIVSVDPVDANYEMMKDYLDLDVPMAFYEFSNRYLIKDYKGKKIYISLLFSQTIADLNKLLGVYSGGSVAHACIDLANMMGCSPILFVGQDLAYTDHKHHADSATHDYDKTLNYRAQMMVKDVFGKQVSTTITLDHFRRRLEDYITAYQEQKRIEFINCSYGADIKGAPHKELEEVLNRQRFDHIKKNCIPIEDLNIDSKATVKEIQTFIDECIIKAEQGFELCGKIILENQTKSLIDVEDNDIDLQRMLYILQIINEFENSPNSKYLGGYFSKFVFDMKQKMFHMYAKDFEKQTSDLQHQARAFKGYFENMKLMLEEVKELVMETVIEFYS
ncbi:MAG: motility associated factor glycosyltransferase family protein [Lachnotalea sp.]